MNTNDDWEDWDDDPSPSEQGGWFHEYTSDFELEEAKRREGY